MAFLPDKPSEVLCLKPDWSERVRGFAAKQKLTLVDMAEQTGLCVTVVRQLRSPSNPRITEKSLKAICKAYQLELSEFIQEVHPVAN